MSQLAQKIVYHPIFSQSIIYVIILAGVLVGLETSPALWEQYESLFHFCDKLIVSIFVLEMFLKLAAHWPKPIDFFKNGWNLLDFVIVVISVLPFHAEFITVFRLVRILRLLRLITGIPKLQILVEALLKSIPSMSYVGILLVLLFYIYGVMGTFLFRGNDPIHFGHLGKSMVTLFQVVTLEGWADIMAIQMYGADQVGYEGKEMLLQVPKAQPLVSIIYFFSFILVGTMIVLNLFIGIIINGMTESQEESKIKKRDKSELGPKSNDDLSQQILRLEEKIEKLVKSINSSERPHFAYAEYRHDKQLYPDGFPEDEKR